MSKYNYDQWATLFTLGRLLMEEHIVWTIENQREIEDPDECVLE